MNIEHLYRLDIIWTGNKGFGTASYESYSRDYIIKHQNKSEIHGSSDPFFKGDLTRYNPEELLVASISSCHMLWLLHLCSNNNIIVEEYIDTPIGIMVEDNDGNGRFKEVNLNPIVTVRRNESLYLLDELHTKAHRFCFISNSVNFPIIVNPKVKAVQ